MHRVNTRTPSAIYGAEEMGNISASEDSVAEVSSATVSQFDAELYKGLWYVVAEIPMPGAKCTYSLSTYFPLSFDRMHVTNYCIVQDKVVGIQEGTLLLGGDAAPGKLELVSDSVSGPRTPYWVYTTDYRSYSIVGGGNGLALWILSRTRTIAGASMSAYIARAGALGYDTSRIVVKGRAIQASQ